jgi:hypothetical protein
MPNPLIVFHAFSKGVGSANAGPPLLYFKLLVKE